jgi:large subunit ribosomal protein L10
MKREDKQVVIEKVTELLKEYSHFYVTDITALNAQETSDLRRICFTSDIKLLMVKNKLMIKALESIGGHYSEIYPALKGTSAIMFSNTGNAPGKLIKEIRRTKEKPLVKGAYVEESIFLGDAQLDKLASLKSKDELVGDIIGLLQSPAKNVVSALQSGGSILHGILKTLSEKE